MATQLQYLGHASFKIQSDYSSILIDPFFTGNPYACCTADDFIALDAMFITHGHFDHLKDAAAIAKSTECAVICGEDVANFLKTQGVSPDLITVMKVGETKNFSFAGVSVVPAVHHSQINVTEPALPDGDPRGYIIEVDRHKVYHAGDTMLFDGMKDFRTLAIDIALLPIGRYEEFPRQRRTPREKSFRCSREAARPFSATRRRRRGAASVPAEVPRAASPAAPSSPSFRG